MQLHYFVTLRGHRGGDIRVRHNSTEFDPNFIKCKTARRKNPVFRRKSGTFQNNPIHRNLSGPRIRSVYYKVFNMKDIIILILTLSLLMLAESYRLPIMKDNSIKDPLKLTELYSRIQSFFNLEYLKSDSVHQTRGIFFVKYLFKLLNNINFFLLHRNENSPQLFSSLRKKECSDGSAESPKISKCTNE